MTIMRMRRCAHASRQRLSSVSPSASFSSYTPGLPVRQATQSTHTGFSKFVRAAAAICLWLLLIIGGLHLIAEALPPAPGEIEVGGGK